MFQVRKLDAFGSKTWRTDPYFFDPVCKVCKQTLVIPLHHVSWKSGFYGDSKNLEFHVHFFFENL